MDESTRYLLELTDTTTAQMSSIAVQDLDVFFKPSSKLDRKSPAVVVNFIQKFKRFTQGD